MIAFKINNALSAILIILIPIQLITTFVFGILSAITFDLLLIPISIIWSVVFLWPLLGLSYIYSKISILKPVVAIIGIPIAFLGHVFIQLIGDMGEKGAKIEKFIVCETFPYTWEYWQYRFNKAEANENLVKVLRILCGVKVYDLHLETFREELYSRPEYINGEIEVNW